MKSSLDTLDHRVLYKNRGNRYLIKARLKRTTLIMAAKCRDGVVIVGDRKVKNGVPPYKEKIKRCGNITWAIFGAAGVGNLFDEFLVLLPQKITAHDLWVRYQNQRLLNEHQQNFGTNAVDVQPPPLYRYSAEDFKQDCVGLLTEMKNRYAVAFEDPQCRLEVLIGFSVENEGAKLYYLDSDYCLPAEANGFLAIGQREFAEVFRKSWSSEMTMKQTAKLGMLAIKYIEQEAISEDIGVGTEEPQVWYISNENQIREVALVELAEMVTDVDTEVSKLRTKMHSLFRS